MSDPNLKVAKQYFTQAPTIGNLWNGVKSVGRALDNTFTDHNPNLITGVAPTGTIKRIPSLSQMPEKFKKLELERAFAEQLKKFENAFLNKPKYKIWRGEKNVEV